MNKSLQGINKQNISYLEIANSMKLGHQTLNQHKKSSLNDKSVNKSKSIKMLSDLTNFSHKKQNSSEFASYWKIVNNTYSPRNNFTIPFQDKSDLNADKQAIDTLSTKYKEYLQNITIIPQNKKTLEDIHEKELCNSNKFVKSLLQQLTALYTKYRALKLDHSETKQLLQRQKQQNSNLTRLAQKSVQAKSAQFSKIVRYLQQELQLTKEESSNIMDSKNKEIQELKLINYQINDKLQVTQQSLDECNQKYQGCNRKIKGLECLLLNYEEILKENEQQIKQKAQKIEKINFQKEQINKQKQELIQKRNQLLQTNADLQKTIKDLREQAKAFGKEKIGILQEYNLKREKNSVQKQQLLLILQQKEQKIGNCNSQIDKLHYLYNTASKKLQEQSQKLKEYSFQYKNTEEQYQIKIKKLVQDIQQQRNKALKKIQEAEKMFKMKQELLKKWIKSKVKQMKLENAKMKKEIKKQILFCAKMSVLDVKENFKNQFGVNSNPYNQNLI